ncbi:MAG: hypothetical protein QOG53_643 [Frankiales bacterium]|jgi:uncharacterized damage-inducible protein DinB|nr:hypothetical protein [Frankiales bacterium]
MVDYSKAPAYESPEREQLEGWLAFHRDTLKRKCEGLSDDQLRERSVPPSALSLLGLVRHMSEVERWWFITVLEREPFVMRYCDEETNRDGDFDDVDAANVAECFANFDEDCQNSRKAVATHASLDDLGDRRGVPVSLRWIMTHMIEEYARHNGHADLLRERIDGKTGD